MQKYWEEKLKSEFKILTNTWNIILTNWKSDTEDIENIYRLRIQLNITAFICRKLMEQTYLANKEDHKYKNEYKSIKVRILKNGNICTPSFYKNIDLMQYPDSFKNKAESFVDLYEACNYIIHERGSSYADDMIFYNKDGDKAKKKIEETSIFYCVETHNLRLRFNKPAKISWFVQWSSENKGEVMIDIKSIMIAFFKFIEVYSRI